MTKPVSWSYTALTSFETCPRRHYLTRVSKEVNEPQTEVLLWGNKVHDALEARANGTAALPPELAHLEGIVSLFTRQHGTRVVEKQLAIDRSFRPVNWRDRSAWCRGIIDIGVVGPQKAVLGDWKTGKRKPESDQLQLFAALAFAHFAHLEEVHTAFIWLKEKKTDQAVFTRQQTGEIWAEFLPRVERLELAHAKNEWPEKPSGLCGKWCPVTKNLCKFGR